MTQPEQGISARDCERIRHSKKHGIEAGELADRFDVTLATIYYHASGDCACDTENPTVSGEDLVRETDCEQFRYKLNAGMSPAEIQTRFTDETVRRHGRGNCDCDIDVEPANSQGGITKQKCERWRQQVTSGEAYTSLAEDSIHHHSTIRKHVTGECNHEDQDTNPVKTDSRENVTEEVYEAIVYLYAEEHLHSGQIKEVIEDEFGVTFSEYTINHHLMGDCTHDLGIG